MLMFLTKLEQKRNDLYLIFCDQFGIKPIVVHPNSHVKSAWHLLTSLIIPGESQG